MIRRGGCCCFFLYCSDLGIKIFEKEILVHLGAYFSSVSCGFFGDYTSLGDMENAVTSNVIEIANFA